MPGVTWNLMMERRWSMTDEELIAEVEKKADAEKKISEVAEKQIKDNQKFAEKHSKMLANNPTEEQVLKLNTEGKKLEF